MTSAKHIPVIIGIGEYKDTPSEPSAALEPIALMEKAMHQANQDNHGHFLNKIDSIDLVGLITWRYKNPVASLCQRLNISPEHQTNASMGGESPVRLVHQAALKIAAGEISTAAIVGGEAMNSMSHARKNKTKLDWTPLASKEEAVHFPSDRIPISPLAKELGIVSPVQMYPLYEMATQDHWQQTPAEGLSYSAELWSQYSKIAADNPYAWQTSISSAKDITKIDNSNRLICWPYPKKMVANPLVNQAAAIIVTNLEAAEQAGITKEHIIHIWGGCAAAEPDDFLHRDCYHHSRAQEAVLKKAIDIAGGNVNKFNKMELYSCFPVVPKMALENLGLDPKKVAPTVTGGLSFFGGPMNNYMSHAICAMVRALRSNPNDIGLIYGQGGFVSKHHALVVSTSPQTSPLSADYSVQSEADHNMGPIPAIAQAYQGPASIETYTVLYARENKPTHGVVILKTPEGLRTMAKVDAGSSSLQLLISTEQSAINVMGEVSNNASGVPVWTAV